MQKKEVIISGQRIGRFRASWLLFKESFRFLRADPEMMWLPLITGVLNLFLLGILFAGFFFIGAQGDFSAFYNEETDSTTLLGYGFLFCCYLVGAFTLALSQAGITHIVNIRVHNGDATLGEGLRKAFSLWFPMLMWSTITATVGIILRVIAERSKLLMRLVVSLLGLAWTALTYFVVPVITLEDVGAIQGIKRSGGTFKKTWGETLVVNISLGLVFGIVFFILFLAMIGAFIYGAFVLENTTLGIISIGIVILLFFVLGLMQATLQGVIKTLLYIYASENIIPDNFNKELLAAVVARQDKVQKMQQPEVSSKKATDTQINTSASTRYDATQGHVRNDDTIVS